MIVDDRGRIAGQRTVSTFQASTDVAADYDELLHRRRSQRRNRAVAIAASVVVAVVAVFSVQANLAADPQPQPMQPAPGLDIGDVPVWYDAAGLHRGDVVEQTPVEIATGGTGTATSRRGAGPGADGCDVPGPRDRRRVVPPLGRRPTHRWTRLRMQAPAGTRMATPPPGSRVLPMICAAMFVIPNSSSTTPPQVAKSHEPCSAAPWATTVVNTVLQATASCRSPPSVSSGPPGTRRTAMTFVPETHLWSRLRMWHDESSSSDRRHVRGRLRPRSPGGIRPAEP